jgi:hypothetical protein
MDSCIVFLEIGSVGGGLPRRGTKRHEEGEGDECCFRGCGVGWGIGEKETGVAGRRGPMGLGADCGLAARTFPRVCQMKWQDQVREKRPGHPRKDTKRERVMSVVFGGAGLVGGSARRGQVWLGVVGQ